MRTHPFACASYKITDVTLKNSQHIFPFTLGFTHPEPGSDCDDYKDLNINLHGVSDLQAFFCGPGVQPGNCDNMWPTLSIATTAWNKTVCSAYACSDSIPLVANLLLNIESLPIADCPKSHKQVCSGDYGRTDGLVRGTCGCGEHRGAPRTQCTCDSGYFGPACQYSCPGGVAVRGFSGLSSCCNKHGRAILTNATTDPVQCDCFQNYIGEACESCSPGHFGEQCEMCPNCTRAPNSNATRHAHCNDGIGGDGSCVCDKDWTGPDCSVYSKGGTPKSWVFTATIVAAGFGFLLIAAAVWKCWFRVSTKRSRALSPPAYDDYGKLKESLLSGATAKDRGHLMHGSEMPSNSASLLSDGMAFSVQSKHLISSLLATRGHDLESPEIQSTQRLVAEIDRLSQSNAQYMINYETLVIGSKIGTGTSGEVFRAQVRLQDHAMGDKSGGLSDRGDFGAEKPQGPVVALKRLYTATVNRKYFMNAFKRELAVLRRMEHPNIVRFIGITIAPPPENTYHVVTELCRCALNDLLERGRGKLPAAILANISHQIAEGMGYLHRQNVVHRDLKPANCLCAGGGNGGTSLLIKICDFGLSRLVSNDVTMMTADIGTPAYMAPEMAAEGELDSVEAGKAIDVYSFAVCLLEIWTQQKPYAGARLNAFQLMIKVINGARPPIPGAHIVPKKVAETIASSWLKAPLMRPSFVEILEEMENDPRYWDLEYPKNELVGPLVGGDQKV